MSFISGKYWAGDPTIKPEQWGPFEDVQAAVMENADNLYGIDPFSIEHYFPFWENAGLFRSVTSKNKAANYYPEWSWSKYGVTSGAKTDAFSNNENSYNQFTVWGTTILNTLQKQAIIEKGAMADEFGIGTSSSAYGIRCYIQSVNYDFESTEAPIVKKPYNFVVTYNGPASNLNDRMQILINGKHPNYTHRDNITTYLSGESPKTLYIGKGESFTTWSWPDLDGIITNLGFSYSYYGVNIGQLLSDNPYGLLQPITRRTYFVPDGDVSLFSCYDTGTVSENISINVGATISDTGDGSDLPGMGADVPVVDSCAGIDIVATSISVAVVDGAGAVDIVSNVLNSLSVSDVSAAIDSVSQVIATAIINDAAVGEETVNTSVLGSIIKTVYDTAAGQDVLGGPVVSFSLSDSAAGADLVASISNALSVSDVVSANDLASVIKEKLINISESVSVVDALSLSVALTVSDVSTAIETFGQILNAININDAGIGTDTAIATNLDMLPSGKVTITFSMRIPGADFAIDFPGADFTIN